MSKRSSIDTFFTSSNATKKSKIEDLAVGEYDKHSSYPIPLPSRFPFELTTNTLHKSITNQTDLNLTYHQPLFPATVAKELYQFLRDEFCWYRVTYEVRGMTINTPRYTTVFGLDETHAFSTPVFPNSRVIEKETNQPPRKPLKCTPRPLPGCLTQLKSTIEQITGTTYNFCLLNYYKDGTDSISYHSDDESFLGKDPCIASISLGCPRDFTMRNKAIHRETWKTCLRSGDMLVMKGATQASWEHAVPKRKTVAGGRINVTFRRAMVPYGTENYYRYNVHHGPYFRWDPAQGSMVLGSTFRCDRTSTQRTSGEVTGSGARGPARVQHEDSFDVLASIRAIDAASAAAAAASQGQESVQSAAPVDASDGEGGLSESVDKDESDELLAQIRAIDEAVAKANGIVS